MTDNDDVDGFETAPATAGVRAIGEHTHANATAPSPLGSDVSPAVVARIETGASAPSGAAASAIGGPDPSTTAGDAEAANPASDAIGARTGGDRR